MFILSFVVRLVPGFLPFPIGLPPPGGRLNTIGQFFSGVPTVHHARKAANKIDGPDEENAEGHDSLSGPGSHRL